MQITYHYFATLLNFTTMSNLKMKWSLTEFEFPFIKDGKKSWQIRTIYITKERFNSHLNLLLYYQWRLICLNKDLSKLLHDQNLQKIRRYYCRYCLHRFIPEDVLRGHLTQCCQHGRSAPNSGMKTTPHFSWKTTTSNWKYHFVM